MPVVLGFPGDGNSCDLDRNVQIPGQLLLPEDVLGRAAGGREHSSLSTALRYHFSLPKQEVIMPDPTFLVIL